MKSKKTLQYAELIEMSEQYVRENRIQASGPDKVARFMRPLLQGKLQEEFWMLSLNNKHEVIAHHMTSMGTADATPVHPRDIFRHACMDNARSIVVVHNHPSGSIYPSGADRVATEKLKQTGEILGIPLMDHIIIGDITESNASGYFSFKESEWIQ